MAHKELVEKSMAILGLSQSGLARAISAARVDGTEITQSAVCKWLRKGYQLNVDDAAIISELTDDEVSFFDFHPSEHVERVFARRERKNKRLEAKAKRKAA